MKATRARAGWVALSAMLALCSVRIPAISQARERPLVYVLRTSDSDSLTNAILLELASRQLAARMIADDRAAAQSEDRYATVRVEHEAVQIAIVGPGGAIHQRETMPRLTRADDPLLARRVAEWLRMQLLVTRTKPLPSELPRGTVPPSSSHSASPDAAASVGGRATGQADERPQESGSASMAARAVDSGALPASALAENSDLSLSSSPSTPASPTASPSPTASETASASATASETASAPPTASALALATASPLASTPALASAQVPAAASSQYRDVSPDAALARILLGSSLSWSPGGLGGSAAANVELSGYPTPAWGVHLFGSLPLTDTTIRHDGDSADIHVYWAGIGAHLRLMVPYSPEIGAGLGVLSFAMYGTAQPPNRSAEDHIAAALPYVRLSAGRNVVGPFGMRLAVLAGWAMPRPVVRFAAEDVANAAHPWLSGTLGVTWDVISRKQQP